LTKLLGKNIDNYNIIWTSCENIFRDVSNGIDLVLCKLVIYSKKNWSNFTLFDFFGKNISLIHWNGGSITQDENFLSIK
jgi:hypothetical protein